MNLVGKIFTVVIAVMCIVFASFALMVHAAHKNWREQVFGPDGDPGKGYQGKLEAAKKQNDDLLQDNKRLAQDQVTERDRYEERIKKLQAANEELTGDRQRLEAARGTWEAEKRKYDAEDKAVHQTLDALRVEADNLRKELQQAVDERQKVYDKLVASNDSATTLEADKQRIEKLLRDLAAVNTRTKNVLEYYKVSEAGMAKDPPPGVYLVTAVPRLDIVEISVGSDDGIRKGHRFAVTRPATGKYLGDIEVIQVNSSYRAVCRVDKATQTAQIQKGDYVQANLSKRR
jgi:hypothetical protein